MTQLIAAYDAEESRGSGHAISFNDLIKELWRGRVILLICLVAALALGLGFVLTSTPQYSAELKMAPAESNFFPSGGGSTAQSFVSVITGGSQQYDDYAHFLDLLHSVRLASVLETRYGIMKEVFPYDAVKKEFVPDAGIQPWLIRTFRSALGLPAWRAPTVADLANYLRDAVEVDKRTDSSTSLTFRDPDPTKARVFLQRLYDESDRLLRDEKQRTHTAMRDYVSKRLADASTIDQRAVLIQLWGREETQMLLLASGDPVGARIIDDISVSSLPSSGATRTLLTAILAGLALAMIIVIIRTAPRRA